MKVLLALVMLIASAAATAQINRCLDKNGKTVGYGECPPGTRSEQSAVRSSPGIPSSPSSSPSSSPQKSLAERDAEFRKRQMEKQEAEAKAERKNTEVEQRKRACDSSQAYLKSLQAGQRISRTDPKTGERSFLSDAEYPKEIESAQRAVAANCKQ